MRNKKVENRDNKEQELSRNKSRDQYKKE